MTSYAINKRWRLRHPKKRNRSKKRYYHKHAKNCWNSWAKWTDLEEALILGKHGLPDWFIGLLIGRSVRAIQGHRHCLLYGSAPAEKIENPPLESGLTT